MIARTFGFDLAGRDEPALRHSIALAAGAAVFRFVPYVLLVVVLLDLMEGEAPLSSSVLFAVLLVAFAADLFLSAQGLERSFGGTYGLVTDMRLRLADRLGRMPLGRVLQRHGGMLTDLFADRFAFYQDVATHMWWHLSTTLVLPLLLWGLLVVLDWRLALTVAAFVPLAALVVPWSFRLLDKGASRAIEAREQAGRAFVDLVEGAKEVRVLDPGRGRTRAAQEAVAALERRSIKAELAPAPAILAFGLVWSLASAAVIVVAALIWSSGGISGATMLAGLVVSVRLCAELAEIGTFLVEFRVARRVLETIRELADEPLQTQTERDTPPADASVELKDVDFSYGDGPALTGFNLAIPAGTMTALVGPSGAGKSTVASLVARLWDVEEGAVRIGGVDVRAMSAETLNRTVSMVLQDVALFEMSVEDNIRLGRPTASRDEVMAAARAARIHERIERLPKGYDSVLVGSGAELSGGERQRVAIARAILKDAPVLVLDEATASIDLENERLIQEALSNLTRNRTTIVIAHRLHTIARADQIAVLEKGRLVEYGTVEELLVRKRGVFRTMWQRQEEARGWQIGRS
ncbi:ABC transporter ATP-binding protein [Amorphus sp. 3PC139-8]|uniref:ABC transporter ATP-binding protein n=1 Tax=Amorphus sp. 3PC139-8 TaxID=2735676 RepID=UPI00345CD2F0